MKTLVINSHPEYDNPNGFSQKLLNAFLTEYDKAYDRKDLTIINLYEEDIPRLDKKVLAMWGKKRSGQDLTAEEAALDARQREILEQFKASHRIVIVAPTHNFMVTSAMKDYMDNILIARETFKYTEAGSVGLMTDDYKALFLVACGSIYTKNDRYTPLELQYRYLKEMFTNIMAFDSFDIVRAQGTSLLPAEEVMATAQKDLAAIFPSFYASN